MVLEGYLDLAPLILRVVVGITFVVHGYPKLFGESMGGPKGVAGFFGQLGIPFPLFFAYVVGVTEFFGGISLILGFLTRIIALLLAMIMVVAISKVKFKTGFISKPLEGGMVGGYELDLVILGAALSLVFLGGGSLSLDSILGLGI